MSHINRKPYEELLHQDHYTLRELSDLLLIQDEVILHEIWNDHLKATRLGGQVISIERDDALDWLRERHDHLLTKD